MINKVFNRTDHRALWHWLAENPGCAKYQWPQWDDNGGNVHKCDSLCFACEYNFDRFNNLTGKCDCSPCPLRWSGKDCLSSEFSRWESAKQDPQERQRLALVIAELPVREGVVWK